MREAARTATARPETNEEESVDEEGEGTEIDQIGERSKERGGEGTCSSPRNLLGCLLQ
jgi:hypothetical protein